MQKVLRSRMSVPSLERRFGGAWGSLPCTIDPIARSLRPRPPGAGLRRWLSVAATVFVLGAPPAHALDPRIRLVDLVHRAWSQGGRRPLGTVGAIAQTQDGYLWFGTDTGLARFDGVRFAWFDSATTPGIRNHNVTSLCATRDGTLWIGTDGGLSRMTGGSVSTLRSEDGLSHDMVRSLAEGHDGTLWIGTYKGLSILRDGRITVPASQGRLRRATLRVLQEDREGSLWIGTKEALYRLRGGQLRSFGTGDGLPSASIRALAAGGNGELWVATDAGLARFVGERFEAIRRAGLGSRLLTALLLDDEGNLWVGGEDTGISRVAQGKVEGLRARDGLLSESVATFLQDREGGLWVATRGGGVDYFRTPRVKVLAGRRRLPTDRVRVVRQDSRERMWIGTVGAGLTLLDTSGRPLESPPMLSSRFIYSVFEDGRGDVWVGTAHGLHRLRAGRVIQVLTKSDGLPGGSARAIAGCRDGTLWLGTGGGLTRLQGGLLSTFTTADGLPANFVSTLFVDRQGTLWIGTRPHGLSRLEHGRIVRDSGAGETACHVSAFHEDAQGVVWMATDCGLLRFEGGRINRFTTAEGLPTNILAAILEDDRGDLWLGSDQGIMRLSRRELEDVALGRSQHLTPSLLDASDGMPTSESNNDGQPAAWKSRDGRLWFATQRGLVIVEPSTAFGPASPLPVMVERIYVDGSPVPLSPLAAAPPGSRTLSLEYTAITFAGPDKVSFRHRLRGFQEEWSYSRARVAAYRDLPPGRYSFELQAWAGSVWSAAANRVELRVEPGPFNMRHRPGLAAFLLVVLAAGAYLLRIGYSRRSSEIQAEERRRVARELHDTVLQEFTGVALQLQAIAQALDGTPLSAKPRLLRVLEQVDGALRDARRAIWGLRTPDDAGSEMPVALAHLVEGLRASTGVPISLRIIGPPRALPDRLASELLRIAQEAASNAVRHASATEVSVQLTFGAAGLELRISDDGQGLPTSARQASVGEGHFGLAGITERVRALGGTLTIRSGAGAGTELLVGVPHSAASRRVARR